jgi:hypothetical protein
LAAIVGVLGGMGGAYIDGSLANQGKSGPSRTSGRPRDRTFVNSLTQSMCRQRALCWSGCRSGQLIPSRFHNNRHETTFSMPQSRQKRLVRSSPSLELQEVTNKLLTALGAEDLDVAEKLRRKFIALAQEDVANVSE